MKKLMHLGMLSALIALLSFMLPAELGAQSAFDFWNPTKEAAVQKSVQASQRARRQPSIWDQLRKTGSLLANPLDKQARQRLAAQRALTRPATASTASAARKAPKFKQIQIPDDQALIVLQVDGDPYGDQSGFTVLLDADATAYDYYVNELNHGNWHNFDYEDAVDPTLWSLYDYTVPEDTENNSNTEKKVIDGSDAIFIPAGTYDFTLGNPTPNANSYWGMSVNGFPYNANDFYHFFADNYAFEGGKQYLFTVYADQYGNVQCDLYIDGELYTGDDNTKAHVTLSVDGDPSKDGSKFQLYIDADGLFSYDDWVNGGQDLVTAAEACEYTIPEGAVPASDNTVGVIDGFQTIDLEPGTYDFALANPYVKGNFSSVDVSFVDPTNLYDDYVLEAGHDYVFRVGCVVDPTGSRESVVRAALFKDGEQVLTNYVFIGDATQRLTLDNIEGFSVWANGGKLTPDLDGSYWVPVGAEVTFVPDLDKKITDVELYTASENYNFDDPTFIIYSFNNYIDDGFYAYDPEFTNANLSDAVLTRTGDKTWSITFNRVTADKTYDFFFSTYFSGQEPAQQTQMYGFMAKSADNNPAVLGNEYDARFISSGGSISLLPIQFALPAEEEDYSVTINLDLSDFDEETKEGAVYSVQIGDSFDPFTSGVFVSAPEDYSANGFAVTASSSVNPNSVLTEVGDQVYEITFDNVMGNQDGYLFELTQLDLNNQSLNEFFATEGNTQVPYGQNNFDAFTPVSGQTYDAAANAETYHPFYLPLTNDDLTYSVTIQLDLHNYDGESGEGAQYTITYAENSAEQEPVIEDILSVGIIGTTSLVNGTESFTPSEADLMEQDPDNANIYTITYEDIAADDVYDFKFCFNGDANLTLSTNSQDMDYGSEWQEAVWNGDQAIVASPDGSGLIRVTLKLDLSEFDPMTGGGAKYLFEYEPMPRRLVWDFAGTDFSEADKNKMDADDDSWIYTYGDNRAENKTSVGLYPLAQGRPISWTSGLEFYNIGEGKLRLDHNSRLNLNGKNLGFLIPVKAGDRLVIIAANAGNSGERRLAASNLTVESGFELVTGTEDVTNSGIVEEDGYVNIVTEGGGINIKKIEIIPADQQQQSFVFLKPSDWYSYTMVYAWDSNGESLLGPWPGAQLNYFEDFLGEGDAGQYWRINVPAGAVGIVLSDDPNGQMNQTVNITDFTHDYQTTGSKDDLNHWEVTTFNYVANGD